MNPDVELALRKQRLLLRSAALRRELAGHVEGAAPALALGERIVGGVSWLRRHPVAIAAAAGLLLAARPRGLVRWARRGLVAWRAWRHARGWIAARVHSVP